MTAAVIILVLFVLQSGAILAAEFRRPDKAVAWLVVLFVLPVVGIVVYYFLAQSYSRKHKLKRRARHPQDMQTRRQQMGSMSPADRQDTTTKADLEIDKDKRLKGLLLHLPQASITRRNLVEFFYNGVETYEAILAAMEEAEDHIHAEYYTIRGDEAGLRFQEVLIRKAQEGVDVRLIYDGIGSKMPAACIRRLEEAGVRTGCFLPPLIALIDKRLNYRNHRKTVVIDGRTGFMGGMNVGNEYLGLDPKLGYWRDTHLKVEGDAVYDLQQTFLTDWRFVNEESLDGTRYFPEHDCDGGETVQIVNSGPDVKWNTMLEMYFAAVTSARSRIYMTTPYFIPDEGLVLALKVAAVSGTDVRILLPAVPDTKIVYWASMSYLEELLQAGVRFHLYEKGFIHAKMLLIDEKLATVGTANVDKRSFFSNFEQNAVLFDRHLIRRLAGQFLLDLRDSREVELAEFERRSRWEKGREVMARLLSPLF